MKILLAGVFVVAVVAGIVFCLLCMAYANQLKDLRQQLKDAARRYDQLYSAYVEACNSNPNRPRITTCTQNQWVGGTTMTQEQWDAMQKPKV